MDESAAPPRRAAPAPGAGDPLEALEQQVRQLTSRLAGWVETQLVQALEDRRNDMKALRSELQVVVNEQLAGIRAETTSMLSVATRRLDVGQEQLSERLDSVAERAGEAATSTIALTSSTTTAAERLEILEEHLGQRLAKLNDHVEGQLAASSDRHGAELEELRTELRAWLAEQRERVARSTSGNDELEQRVRAAMNQLIESVEARLAEVTAARQAELDTLRSEVAERLRNEAEAGTGRIDALEHQMKTAMGHLVDLVETRLAESATARQAEIEGLRSELQKALDQLSTEMRTQVTGAASTLLTRFNQAQERLERVEEQHRQGADAIGQMVEAKLAEVVERRQGELDAVKFELQEALAKQLAEARSEIGTAVANAHRRFVTSVEQLDERMNAVAQQATGAAAAVGTLDETVRADGARVEALELHTRRTDARLTELVEAKLGEVAWHGQAEMDERMSRVAEQSTSMVARVEMLERRLQDSDDRLVNLVDWKLSELAQQRSTDLEQLRGELRSALGIHLAETRDEVASALDEGRRALARGEAQIDRRQATLDMQASEAVKSLDALGASVEVALREAEERLGQTVQARLAEVAAVVAQVGDARADMAETTTALNRKVARAQDHVNKKLATLAHRVDALAEATARAPSIEAGTLAPIRSDLRLLEGQVAELAEVVADLRARRKAPAQAAAPAKAAKRAKVAKATKRAKAGKSPSAVTQ